MITFCHLQLPSCLMNASGCNSSTHEQLRALDKTPACSMVVSKSATLLPQRGNPAPRFFINKEQCINAMGLPNHGIDYYNHIKLDKLYIQSIYPHTVDDLKHLLNTTSHMIEVNLSCPNTSLLNNGAFAPLGFKRFDEIGRAHV